MNNFFANIFTDVQRNWFYIFGSILIVLLGVYIGMHLRMRGQENVNFTRSELANIAKLVSSLRQDTALNKNFGVSKEKLNAIIVSNVEQYINSRYDVDYDQDHSLPAFLNQYAAAGFDDSFLTDYKLRVKSFFWLTEDYLFLEIIFWSLFGVLCSLFYHISEAMARCEYNLDQKYIHAAKLFYAPLTSLIIYFSLNALISNSEANLNSLRHGLIILSFLLGFFSGRTIELLNRMKDLFFPSKENKVFTSTTTTNAASTEASETVVDEATPGELETVG